MSVRPRGNSGRVSDGKGCGVPTGFFYGILSPAPFGFKICDGCDILAYHNFSVLVIFSI
jgi:hypothetical protein